MDDGDARDYVATRLHYIHATLKRQSLSELNNPRGLQAMS